MPKSSAGFPASFLASSHSSAVGLSDACVRLAPLAAQALSHSDHSRKLRPFTALIPAFSVLQPDFRAPTKIFLLEVRLGAFTRSFPSPWDLRPLLWPTAEYLVDFPP